MNNTNQNQRDNGTPNGTEAQRTNNGGKMKPITDTEIGEMERELAYALVEALNEETNGFGSSGEWLFGADDRDVQVKDESDEAGRGPKLVQTITLEVSDPSTYDDPKIRHDVLTFEITAKLIGRTEKTEPNTPEEEE